MLLLGVPNLSEGRDERRIAGLRDAFAGYASLLDVHSDADHNRTVLTLGGSPEAVEASLLAGARAAVEAIDLRSHRGLHPRVGALDVCPVVWLGAEAREEAIEVAHEIADGIAEGLGVPVFLYGELAASEERRERAFFRDGGPEELARRLGEGELEPDLGPARLHPTAGATLVTARPPLVAFNVEIEAPGVEVASVIAGKLRETNGGLPGVRAIGLELGDRRLQVSVNVGDPYATPLARVVETVRELAEPHGARPVACELIGLAPEAALDGFPEWIEIRGFDPAQHLIERRVEGLDSR